MMDTVSTPPSRPLRPAVIAAHGALAAVLFVLAVPGVRRMLSQATAGDIPDPLAVGLVVVPVGVSATILALLWRWLRRGGAWELALTDAALALVAWWVGWLYLMSKSLVVVLALVALLGLGPACFVLAVAAAVLERRRVARA
ncbi:MAG: hypothetical protein A2V85_07165 [Chloroflexi bacterium RBG_16_72_14]|nr:MAG: hypothetical protein A2V85_07165 [Chloroflexi bacterium RBG_16_72_14]